MLAHSGAICAILIAVLPGEDAYRAGKVAEAQSNYAAARAAYETCAASPGPLTAFAQIRAAVCRANTGETQAAVAALESLVAKGPVSPWTALARHELGRIQHTAGNYRSADRHFDAAHRFHADVWWLEDARWPAAVNALATPETRERGLDFFRAMVGSPWPDKRLGSATILIDATDPQDRLQGVLGLLRSGKTDRAQTAFERIDATDTDAALHRYAAGRLLLSQEKTDQGRAALLTLARDHSDDSHAAQALRDVIDSHLKDNDFAGALRVWAELDAKFPGGSNSIRARTSIASRYARARRWSDAAQHYAWIVDNAADATSIARARMELARAYLKLDDPQAELRTYEQQATDAPTRAETIEAAFHSGELHRQSGAEDKAVAHYRLAASNGITRYHGFRAQERLAELGDAQAAREPRLQTSTRTSLVRALNLPQSAPPAPSPEFERLRFFGREGFMEAEWETMFHAQRTDPKVDAVLYQALGTAGPAYTVMQLADAANLGENSDGTQTVERLRIRYPRAYWDLVQTSAQRHNLDPYLVLSIARQESTYRPGLVSGAGARGVMQMMPRTAEGLAKEEPTLDVKRLDHPPTSITLGTRYLRGLIDRYDGNLVYALAAYNAGPANCDRWRRDFQGSDLAAFIETITYTETRNYVKRVLAHYATYHSIYPDPS